MIELPESNNLAQQFRETLVNKTIMNVYANTSPHKFAWFSTEPEKYHDLLSERKITGAIASGGMPELFAGDIRIILTDGVNIRYFEPNEKIPAKHQLHIEFEDNSSIVCSVQMYGAMWVLTNGQTENYNEIARSSPSPLANEFNLYYFNKLYNRVNDSKLSAKAFLATNQRIPGLGNGVLQDILFNAKIHPKRKMQTLSPDEYEKMFHSIKSTLFEMTLHGGRNTEKDLFGISGGYQTKLSSKTINLPCPVCGGEISKEAYLGGAIYYCAICQPLI